MADASSEWKHSDFFALSEADEIVLKKQIAQCLGVRYANVKQDKPLSESTYGVTPFSKDAVESALGNLDTAQKALSTNPQDPALLAAEKAASVMVCTISGLLVRWKPLKPANVGYILEWGERKLEAWDPAIERRAGGLDNKVPWEAQHLTLSNSSSLLALIVEIVYFYKHGMLKPLFRGEPLEPEIASLVSAFKGIRVSLHLRAIADEVELMNASENVDQFERKRHTELDNLQTVAVWQRNVIVHGLSGTPLDCFKYAVALADCRADKPPPWLVSELKGRVNSFETRLSIVKEKNKQWFTTNKVAPQHCQMNSYSNLALRLRFIKGFHALDKLAELASKMGMLRLVSKPFPVPKSVLLGSGILSSEAFSTSAERDSVPSWRNASSFSGKCLVFDW